MTPTKDAPRVIVACRIMKPEIDALVNITPHVETRYLEASLHDTPEKMPGMIQEEIDRASAYASQIVIGYGLCSNGTVGLTAPRQGLIIPRVHDCIALLLGSQEAYNKLSREKPGTFYLTPGWVEERKDPLGYMENSYVPKLGREMAEWGIREELKHYTHIILINTGSKDMAPVRKIAMENARFLEKEYEEIDGKSYYFKMIVTGPYPEEAFIHISPGETMRQNLMIG